MCGRRAPSTTPWSRVWPASRTPIALSLRREVGDATVCLHYPASDGYCAYRWTYDKRKRQLTVDVTGSFSQATLRVLLPAGARPRRATCAGTALALRLETVERSRYAVIALDGSPGDAVVLAW